MKQKQSKGSRIAMFIVIPLVTIIIAMVVFIPGSPKTENSKVSIEEVTAAKAYGVSQKFVTEILSSPSTADFPWSYDNYVQDDATTFWISGHVDSQNAFGATIRTNYLIGLRYKSGDWLSKNSWELLELTIL